MPWKDQGGSGDGPWGGGGSGPGSKGPEDGKNPWVRRPANPQNQKVDDLINGLIEKLRRMMGGGGGGGSKSPRARMGGAFLGLGIAFLVWLSTGLCRVNEGENGVILRFGEMIAITTAGLHYHWPTPFERVIVQRVSAVNRIDGGARLDAKGATADNTDQTLILTGDENMVLTNYTVLWRIKDIKDFLFTARDPEDTIQVAAESVLREVFGVSTARSVLTEGRDSIGQKTQEFLQKLMDEYHLGVEIVSVQLQRVEPPAEVVEAFNDVQASLVDADRSRNEAEGYRNDIVPRARGEAQKIIKGAEAYTYQVVAHAEGEGLRFTKMLEVLSQNKQLIMTRSYLDTMQEVFGNTHKIIIDSKVAKSVMSYLPLNELRKGKAMPSKMPGAGEKPAIPDANETTKQAGG
ncbi:MAG: FtsH protease activity modulator HflK [Alphaproteobacteria bacterium]